jgi:hypothetical protein
MNRSTSPRGRKVVQLTFSRHGGARRGAGRKPKGEHALVPHVSRSAVTRHSPVLVTRKLGDGMPRLRRHEALQVLRDTFAAGGCRHGMRLVHDSIQSNHIHALIEALDASSLSRGMRASCVRIARALNRLWTRCGRVFADRFHSRVLRTPREVRSALAYVLCNARKHGARLLGLDAYSSAAAFDGWIDARRPIDSFPCTTVAAAPPRSWLLTSGWRRHGRIRIDEVPGRGR